MVHALRSRRVVMPEGEREAAVLIEGERILAVVEPGSVPADVPCEDLGELTLLPGLIDAHTHLNEPGRTEWEGFRTGTRAAAAGGFTTIVDMPLNCLPETTNVAALELKRTAAQGKAYVDFALWGGAVNGNQTDLIPLARAGVAGFKCFLIYPGCEGFTSIDRENLEASLPAIAETGLPLLVHAELAEPIEQATAALRASNADWRRYSTYQASRPDAAELDAIAMLLQLCRQYRFRLHIVHLSTASALPMLAAAKHEGLPVSVETCPHYLHLAAEAIADGATLSKCAPPIRSAANREALWRGLLDGTIDLIATDHSPCPPEMKLLEPAGTGRFDEAWGGISSLSTALPVLWTECLQRGISLVQLSRWMATEPARLAGIGSCCGTTEPGKYANLVAFDPQAMVTVTPERLFYRHPVSPYMGEHLHGVVHSTWLRGERVFRAGEIAAEPRGREVLRSSQASARTVGTAPEALLASWNAQPDEGAAAAILPCNGCLEWAEGMAAARPVGSVGELLATADRVWRNLPQTAWQQAFDSHPRIGETEAISATEGSRQWSRGEQIAAQADVALQGKLAAANRAYEAKFGRIFLICAMGKSAAEIVAALEVRLHHESATEFLEAAEQQRRITQLRLRKWLALPPARCEDV